MSRFRVEISSPIMSIRCWIFRSFISQLSHSESCRYSRYYLFFGVTRLVLFFFPRLDIYARANGFYLDGSRKGDVFHGHWKVRVMIFPANFQRVCCGLIFSLRAIRLQRIISVDTPPPFFPFFLASLPPSFSPFFFPRSDFIVKRLVRFNRPAATTHSREAKYFHTRRQNCFRTWRNTNTPFG